MNKRNANQLTHSRKLGRGTLDERVESVTRHSIEVTVREVTKRAAERFVQHAA